MSIKNILDEIAAEPGTNAKMEILAKYKENELLKKVLYLAYSKRIKFYIRHIPEYVKEEFEIAMPLDQALFNLVEVIASRKMTGKIAAIFLQNLLNSCNPDDSYVIECIIDKDCKIGMGTTNINKIFPKLIEKTPYMGATSFDAKKAKNLFIDGKPVFSQVKMDGRYCNVIIRSGEVEAESRGGESTLLDGCIFMDELSTLGDCVLNGELTIDGISRYESNGIIASIIDILKKSDERGPEITAKKIEEFEERHILFDDALTRIRFTIWDKITIDEYYDNKSKIGYETRFNGLKEVLEEAKLSMVSLVETRIVFSYQEAIEHFQEMLNRGEEGTVLKSMDGTWKDGKPNWQIKMKLEMDVDLKIVGFNYGTGKNSDLISSLTCETSDGILKTKPTGISEKDMKYITENQDILLGTIIECKCSGLSHDNDGNYALLHPVFKKFRDDKSECDSLESVKKIEAMIKGLA